MRHGVKLNPLGRKRAHRKQLLKNLSCQLIQYKRIQTTLAKAKVLRTHIEPLITKAKDDTTHNRRIVFSYLQDKEAIKELFSDVRAKVADRPGGYTRIIKLPKRLGDNADMAMIELVDFNEIYNPNEEVGSKKKKTRRAKVKKTETAATETTEKVEKTEEVAETPVVDETIAEASTEEPKTDNEDDSLVS